jgi:DNA polymerase III subunit delta'
LAAKVWSRTLPKPADKADIPLALLIGDQEHRMREGLCHRLGMKPFMGGRKIAIIDDADFLNVAGANCLLKTLEEPPPGSVLILVGTSPAKQLPTIRSRCQLVRFQPLEPAVVAELLVAKGLVADAAEASRLAAHSGGSVQRALELADTELWNFRSLLFERLAEPVPDVLRLVGALLAVVDKSSREAAERRLRLRQVIGFAAEFYEHLLRGLSGAELPDDQELRRWVDRAIHNSSGDATVVGACLDRCLVAMEQVDRNANQTTLLERWLDDLAGIVGR